MRFPTLVTECRNRHDAPADHSLPEMMRLSGSEPLPKLTGKNAFTVMWG
jgi:hypothetical protein